MRKGEERRPLSAGDWLRALPWLALAEAVYLAPYFFRAGGVAAKYIWDEHCVSHTYPVAWLARQEVLSGFFPLWNPYSACGLPLLGNTLDETLLPYAVVKYLLPFPLGLNVYLAIKLFLALSGAFALGRSLGGSRNSALLGGILYGFTGFITLNINSVIGSTFILPWCLFGMHRLALRPVFHSFLATAAAFGIILLGGNPQTPYQALLLGYGLYLVALISRRTPFTISRYLLFPGLAAAGGLVLALPQLLPFAEYLSRAFSHHFPGYGRLHLDPRGIIGVMSPLWNPAIVNMCGQFFRSPEEVLATAFLQASDYSNTTIPVPFEHLGLAAVFFLILALPHLRRLPSAASYFAAVAIACLGLAYGLFPFSLIAEIPPFDQVSNWRFTTFPAGLACSALAAMLFSRRHAPALRRTLIPVLGALGIIAVIGMALVASQAGLPLNSFFILGPTMGVVVLFALLAAASVSRRPQSLLVFCFLELFLYDRLTDRPLLPHPHQMLKKNSAAVTSCAPPDPNHRFLAYDEVLHPSLGLLLDRYDFRSYEMIFPDDFVQWLAAVNNWDPLAIVRYYMTHYYFAAEPSALLSPEIKKAAVSSLLAQDFLPSSPAAEDATKNPDLIAPAADFVRPAGETIAGVRRNGWFQHAPSRFRIPSLPVTGAEVRGYVSLLKSSWTKGRSDGVLFQLLGEKTEGREGLLYSRFLHPGGRSEERKWIPLDLAPAPGGEIKAAVLPGPRDDNRSDFAIFADFHNPAARRKFELVYTLREAGEFKCYEAENVLPRLRVAEKVTVTRDLTECLEGVRHGAFATEAETVVDNAGGAWPVGRGKVKKVEWGTNLVRTEVEMAAAGTLVLADTFFPGWTAEIDGRPVRLHRANCIFRAVQVPAGRHEVAFRFVPPSFQIGLWAGIGGWLIFLAAVLRQRRPRGNRRFNLFENPDRPAGGVSSAGA